MFDPFANHSNRVDATESIPTSQDDALDRPKALQQILRWITRQQQISLTELAQHFEQDEATMYSLLTTLMEQGFIHVVEVDGESYYSPKLASRKGRRVPSQIWEKLEE